MPHKDPERRHLMQTRARHARVARIRVELRELKLFRGCADCGYDAHHAGLEFSLREGEVVATNMTTLASQGKRARVWADAPKYDVLCGTCRAIRRWIKQNPDTKDA